MPVTHVSRNGKTYYLHIGPKRGGGIQHFFSTESEGSLAQRLPEGFEVYETVNGRVYLRRRQPKLIRDDEYACLAHQLESPRARHWLWQPKKRALRCEDGDPERLAHAGQSLVLRSTTS